MMERHSLRVLIVDDRPSDADFILLALRSGGIECISQRVDNDKDFENCLAEASWDVILCDHLMPDYDALQALRTLKRLALDTPCIIVSGGAGEEAVVEMLKLGAQDLVPKDKLGRLAPIILRAINDSKERAFRRQAELTLARTTLNLKRLQRFFPPQIAEAILTGEIADPFRWRRADVIVLFIDLRGFTQFSEAASPDQVMCTLQSYYSEIAQVAHKQEGTIGHLAGDGVMMIFNDPVPLEKPLHRATEAALSIRESLSRICDDNKTLGFNLSFGIGIADGPATIGGIGEAGCWDYTVIGTVSNLAARLCARARDGQILVSVSYLSGVVDSFHFDKIGPVDFKGMKDSVEIYDVVEKL